jgi:hypothetical protein
MIVGMRACIYDVYTLSTGAQKEKPAWILAGLSVPTYTFRSGCPGASFWRRRAGEETEVYIKPR